MNRAPIKGFEKDVGSRTTHHILYPESGADYHPGASLILLPFKPKDIQWLQNIFTDKKTLRQDTITDKNLECQTVNSMFL